MGGKWGLGVGERGGIRGTDGGKGGEVEGVFRERSGVMRMKKGEGRRGERLKREKWGEKGGEWGN